MLLPPIVPVKSCIASINANGKLSDERFDMLSQSYETEQKQLEAEAITLRQEIEIQERQNENIDKFIQKAKNYVGIDKLDPYLPREFVQAIYNPTSPAANGNSTSTSSMTISDLSL